jgi:hypothetical protein
MSDIYCIWHNRYSGFYFKPKYEASAREAIAMLLMDATLDEALHEMWASYPRSLVDYQIPGMGRIRKWEGYREYYIMETFLEGVTLDEGVSNALERNHVEEDSQGNTTA